MNTYLKTSLILIGVFSASAIIYFIAKQSPVAYFVMGAALLYFGAYKFLK